MGRCQYPSSAAVRLPIVSLRPVVQGVICNAAIAGALRSLVPLHDEFGRTLPVLVFVDQKEVENETDFVDCCLRARRLVAACATSFLG
jgi:hypothetical protein